MTLTIRGPKKRALFRALCRRWLTALEAARVVGVHSLSQRCTEWERSEAFAAAGYVLHRRWVDLPSGSRVLAYRIGRATRWSA